jgi:hypothetical protein
MRTTPLLAARTSSARVGGSDTDGEGASDVVVAGVSGIRHFKRGEGGISPSDFGKEF